MRRPTPAPRSEALGAVLRRRVDDAANDAVAVSEYTTISVQPASVVSCLDTSHQPMQRSLHVQHRVT